MSDRLDQLLMALREQPHEILPGLEARVLATIDGRHASNLLVLLRGTSVAAALGLGMVGGSLAANAAARKPPEISAFSVDAHLAPSTLLAGR